MDGAGGSLVLLLLLFPLYEFRNIMQHEFYTLVLTIITVIQLLVGDSTSGDEQGCGSITTM